MTSIEKVQNSVTPQMAIDMVALYNSGASINEVAREFKVHRETAARHLRAGGAQMRSLGLNDAQVDLAAELYLSGLTLAQVGERVGVAQGTVGRYLRARGIELRPPLIRVRVTPHCQKRENAVLKE
ncbi:MAG: hypothetical protein KF916_01635 [Microbacteriaceae bacterium]|nr:hypothetical protein [Microbacteriaceae bacterium]